MNAHGFAVNLAPVARAGIGVFAAGLAGHMHPPFPVGHLVGAAGLGFGLRLQRGRALIGAVFSATGHAVALVREQAEHAIGRAINEAVDVAGSSAVPGVLAGTLADHAGRIGAPTDGTTAGVVAHAVFVGEGLTNGGFAGTGLRRFARVGLRVVNVGRSTPRAVTIKVVTILTVVLQIRVIPHHETISPTRITEIEPIRLTAYGRRHSRTGSIRRRMPSRAIATTNPVIILRPRTRDARKTPGKKPRSKGPDKTPDSRRTWVHHLATRPVEKKGPANRAHGTDTGLTGRGACT
ncbi:hypothetical protein D9M68_691730 [compost metagenome]